MIDFNFYVVCPRILNCSRGATVRKGAHLLVLFCTSLSSCGYGRSTPAGAHVTLANKYNVDL
jgi:hypothetical protein